MSHLYNRVGKVYVAIIHIATVMKSDLSNDKSIVACIINRCFSRSELVYNGMLCYRWNNGQWRLRDWRGFSTRGVRFSWRFSVAKVSCYAAVTLIFRAVSRDSNDGVVVCIRVMVCVVANNSIWICCDRISFKIN